MSNVNNISPLEFRTIQEVADYLRVSRNTVWRWCVSGELEGIKVGRNWRISQLALEKFMKQTKQRR